jgi:hypothetical protein
MKRFNLELLGFVCRRTDKAGEGKSDPLSPALETLKFEEPPYNFS